MQKPLTSKPPTHTPAEVHSIMLAAAQDCVDVRDPQPRDPVAHPHLILRPPGARRYIGTLAADPGDQLEHEDH